MIFNEFLYFGTRFLRATPYAAMTYFVIQLSSTVLDDFRNPLNIAAKDVFFTFNNEYYEQIDGVYMCECVYMCGCECACARARACACACARVCNLQLKNRLLKNGKKYFDLKQIRCHRKL